jgi:hypothetical protein
VSSPRTALFFQLEADWPRKPAPVRVRLPLGVREMNVNGVVVTGEPGNWLDLDSISVAREAAQKAR